MVKSQSWNEKLKIKVYQDLSSAVKYPCTNKRLLGCSYMMSANSSMFVWITYSKFAVFFHIIVSSLWKLFSTPPFYCWCIVWTTLWQFWKSFHNAKSWFFFSISDPSKEFYILYWYIQIYTSAVMGGTVANAWSLTGLWEIEKRRWQWLHPGEVAATMASLPAKNIPWQPCIHIKDSTYQFKVTL